MINPAEAFDMPTRVALAGEANEAPSVHNVQPTRFRFEPDGAITLLENCARRLTIADPAGADAWKSLGAAGEGLAMALSARGFGAVITPLAGEPSEGLRPAARLVIAGDAAPDALRSYVPKRATWRGAFAPRSAQSARAIDGLRIQEDLHLVDTPAVIAEIAALYDDTSLKTLRQPEFRQELKSWMRLSALHRDWGRDGLNARAMALSGFEAFGADYVMGKRLFPLLDGMGLAGPLIAEGAKVRSAAALGFFHRPADEHEFDTGRRFYRLWLEITAAGLHLCPMSVLADTPDVAGRLKQRFNIGEERKLVNVFRMGVLPERAKIGKRSRLSPWSLVVAPTEA